MLRRLPGLIWRRDFLRTSRQMVRRRSLRLAILDPIERCEHLNLGRYRWEETMANTEIENVRSVLEAIKAQDSDRAKGTHEGDPCAYIDLYRVENLKVVGLQNHVCGIHQGWPRQLA